MKQLTEHIYKFILPVFLSNLIHLLIVKNNYFPSLAKPISISLFGLNKTYRAFLFLPLICGCFSLFFRTVTIHEHDLACSFLVGYIMGFIYLLAELPNSFIKRKLGIAPGALHERYKGLQYFVDKIDSLIPLCVFYYFVTGISLQITFQLFVISFIINVTFSVLIYKSKIKNAF